MSLTYCSMYSINSSNEGGSAISERPPLAGIEPGIIPFSYAARLFGREKRDVIN